MRKVEEEKEVQTDKASKALVWDCGSSLYDSFELKSFERQLNSAISSRRTLSMPHLTDRRSALPPSPPPKPMSKKSSSSKFSRPFQKLLRSIFGRKQTSNSLFNNDKREGSEDGFSSVYGGSGSLSAIAEIPETTTGGGDYDGGFSPGVKSLLTKAASDRFTATSIGISCA
ncbi:hypothetical protein U1Q18_021148 [Sarracenia purpurea var. burkii]